MCVLLSTYPAVSMKISQFAPDGRVPAVLNVDQSAFCPLDTAARYLLSFVQTVPQECSRPLR